MRPKWGLDFSIDYCDREGNVFELLHWEYDGFDYNEVAGKKEIMDEFLVNQDWDERAQTMLGTQVWNGTDWAFLSRVHGKPSSLA